MVATDTSSHDRRFSDRLLGIAATITAGVLLLGLGGAFAAYKQVLELGGTVTALQKSIDEWRKDQTSRMDRIERKVDSLYERGVARTELPK